MMYLSHHKVLPAYRGLPKAKRWAFPWIVHVAMLLSVLVSVSVGLFGALQLGSGVSGNFLKIAARTPTHTDDTATGKGGIDTILTLHMRIALAVVAFGALVAIPSVCSRFLLLLERMLAECLDGEEAKSLRKILQWVGTPVILALATLAAVLIGDLAKCADLMGSSAGVLVAFVYPGLVFTARWEIEAFPGYVIISSKARRLCREKKLGLIAKWTALVISVLGMAVGTIGLMGTLLAW
jgi:amino acid permease